MAEYDAIEQAYKRGFEDGRASVTLNDAATMVRDYCYTHDCIECQFKECPVMCIPSGWHSPVDAEKAEKNDSK